MVGRLVVTPVTDARRGASARIAIDGPPDPRDLPGDFGHRHEIAVRFADTDAMGHVNNAVYLTYVESARVAWWRPRPASLIQREPGRAEGLILAEASTSPSGRPCSTARP